LFCSSRHFCDMLQKCYQHFFIFCCFWCVIVPLTGVITYVFTARCTLVQSAVLGSRVVCLSVCLSVMLVDCDHIGWNSSKIISPLVSLRCSLSADPNIRGLRQGEYPEILAQSDPPPVDVSVEDIDRKLWLNGYRERNGHNGEPIGNHHRSFEWCHHWPLRLPLPPKMGVPYAPRYANGHIAATGDPIHFMFGSRVGFSGLADRMALFPVTSNPSWRQAAILDNFEWPYLRNGSFDSLI